MPWIARACQDLCVSSGDILPSSVASSATVSDLAQTGRRSSNRTAKAFKARFHP